ncbi:glycoside hydrolase family 32 protein [Lactobacillus sp. DCY120]|uniref:Glycoside hydrolase family 32 protein n=1 Tax=Bombilactobacillus apium TaxID=2675299 RepID=A0A850RCA7_9LACO|nr:GH32 C-terminal domain-containing protein [Bombilactobacillus apium]NVY96936.1 glycoside hydrolase family 32 protein [Bombilactobacillus apium]
MKKWQIWSLAMGVLLGISAGVSSAQAESLTSTEHVGRYHLTTVDGWSNDLQSIIWNAQGQYYDLYFLHSADGARNPFGPQGQNWNHTTTKDFVKFTPQNNALKAFGPQKSTSWKSAWTGTVIANQGQIKGVPQGALVSYFSGLSQKDGSQNIWAAWSDDQGKTFTHPLNNGAPVLDHSWTWASPNHSDERDPGVFYWNKKLIMYVAEGSQLGVYQSQDGLKWSKAEAGTTSKIGPADFMRGLDSRDSAPVECPTLKTLTLPNGQSKQVLFYGGKAPHNGQTTGTYYVVGHLNDAGIFQPETDAKRLDQGSDYYGANFSGNSDLKQADSEIISMGWVGNWNYISNGVHSDPAGQSPYAQRLGSYSLARKLQLQSDLTLKQTPIYPIPKKQTETKATVEEPVNDRTGQKKYSIGQDTNGKIWNLFDKPNLGINKFYNLKFKNTQANYQGRIYLHIWQGSDYVKFNYDPSNGAYLVNGESGELKNGFNGQGGADYYANGELGQGRGYFNNSGVSQQSEIQLQVFTDQNSIEIFFPNGQSYTVARFGSAAQQDFKIYTEDPTGANQVLISQADLG